MLDSFPVNVSTGNGTTWRQVRVLTAADRVLVFMHDGGGPRLVEEAGLTGPVDYRRAVRSLPTDRGDWYVEPAGGCGCHNPLKRVGRRELLKAAGIIHE